MVERIYITYILQSGKFHCSTGATNLYTLPPPRTRHFGVKESSRGSEFSIGNIILLPGITFPLWSEFVLYVRSLPHLPLPPIALSSVGL